MELEHLDDHADAEPQTTERSEPGSGQTPLAAPFVSEGLEQVRDSHC